MKIISNIVLTLAAVSCSGCASVKEVYGPDGQPAQAISCSNFGLNWSDCYETAGELCGSRGYKVWNQAMSQHAVASGTPEFPTTSTSESRTLLIACKGEQPAAEGSTPKSQ